MQSDEEDRKLVIVLRILWSGGVARLAIEEARHLGAQLIVYRKSEQKNTYDLEGINVTFLTIRRSKLIVSFLKYITKLFAHERGNEAVVDLDLIVRGSRRIHGFAIYTDPLAGLTGLIRKFLFGDKYCVFLQETTFGKKGYSQLRYFMWKAIDKLVLSNAALVLTLTDWNRDLLSKLGIEAHTVSAGCYPVATPNLDHRSIILTVSMWDVGRRPEVYVELAKLTGLDLVIAGNWTDYEYMRRFISANNKFVTVTGPISDNQLNELYDRSLAYIRFGFDERGPGMGGLEAMAHGVPVLTNPDLGIREIIEDYYNGFIVNNMRQASDKILELSDNRSLLEHMSLNALETANKYTWEAHKKMILQLISNV